MSMKRVKDSGIGKAPGPQQQADLLEEETPVPFICLKHPRAVYFDGKICPACQAEREFKNLTRGMLFSSPTKPVQRGII